MIGDIAKFNLIAFPDFLQVLTDNSSLVHRVTEHALLDEVHGFDLRPLTAPLVLEYLRR